MLQLIYVSRAAADLVEQDVKDILATAIAFNGANDVTGLLVFDGTWFMQALEGPDETVAALYARIRADRRNRDVGLVSHTPIEERAFGSWAMAWNPVAPIGVGEPLDEIVAALVANVSDVDVRRAFRQFVGIAAAGKRLSSSSRRQQ